MFVLVSGKMLSVQVFLPYKDEEFNVELVVLHVVGSFVLSHLILEIVQVEVVVLV